MTPAPQVTTAALDVSGLSHAFGPRQALRDVGFSLDPGDFTVLLGLNGAGKTTLFALVTRLYHSRQGRIAVFGHDIRRQPSAALAAMGVVFQQPTLDLDLTVRQNLAYHASLHGLAGSRARTRIEEELERVGLADRRNARVRQLSGGQRRRVELARALVHDPALLLLDEPTVGLDIESRRFLIDHVRHLCRSRDMAVLWATHLIDEADDTAKVIVLHQGQVLDQGPVPQVAARAGAATLRAAFDTLTGAAR
ncbi:ABC transporter ATP-binding protein [Nitrospirillum sp. BR 11163]|uniref:ABC transporter ATP-binding protein n=1 Tax=Nitrospirillum sp. BR 11163 TaxID=3104323 RepID=UPI002AFF625C|nr:ABC transporter ATP-binding protein [Nitrospirillum sp. BR 11163]MEA1673336.1 ABC transporter ATP-binding protein [Nitrospirillum sp. BR 11163]